MSYHVESLCDRHKFGSAARKQIAMYLASKASDDGSGIWCSKYTMARHTELSLATVKRTIREFLAEGILIETGERHPCDHGHTVVYRMVLDVVARLELLCPRRSTRPTGVTVNPVQSAPSRGVVVTPLPDSPRPPNHPETIHKPPSRVPAREAAAECLEILTAYPSDRCRSESTSLSHIEAAMQEVGHAKLLSAVKRYALETAGHTRSRVCFSDNWFRTGRWRDHIADEPESPQAPTPAHAAKTADWIRSRHPLCRTLSVGQVRMALDLELVSLTEVYAAGFNEVLRHV